MTRVLVSGRVLDRQVGGNTRYARTVYSGLRRHGIDYTIGRPAGSGSRLRPVSYAVWEGLILPTSKLEQFDVLHYPVDTGALVPSRIPVVATIQGLATLHVDNVRSPAADLLWRTRVTRLAELADRIITGSESSAADIVTVAPGSASKIVTIPHGIDHSKFSPERGPDDDAELAAAGIDGPYFLYLGNLDPRKNIIELAKAAERVFEQTGIPLIVAGAAAWDSDEIVEVVQNTKGVRYLGRVSEALLLPLLRNALAFCFPSKYEGFGFPVVEAMACGTPVICSHEGSLREVAADAALIVEGLGREDIERSMLRVATEPGLADELRAKGLRNAQRFQWEESIAAHANVLKETAR
ncbi:glycosyltransferase family 4 protein [Pseudoclavibacter helvolus]|uniref:glycosyltransferase family 4 protein n=1 Tax=Pseudoclavibacter helvolus TaxID=255205 RepID=UPI003C712B3A